MILNNYWKYLNTVLTNDRLLSDTILNTNLVDITGAAVSMTFDCPGGDSGNKSKANNNCRLDRNPIMRVSTEEIEGSITSDAYTLGSSDVTSSFTISNPQISLSYDANGFHKLYTASFTNNTSTDITIKTVGIGKDILWTWSNGSTKSVLFGIITLTESVTIPAGTSKTIVVEWTES